MIQGGKVEHSGVELLHPYGAAAAPDIAGEAVDLADMDHGDGFFSYRLGGLLEIQTLLYRHHEYVDAIAGSPGHQSFEHRRRVLAQAPGHCGPIHRYPLLVGVGVGGVGDLLLLQRPHDVGFFFLVLCHVALPRRYETMVRPQMYMPSMTTVPITQPTFCMER